MIGGRIALFTDPTRAAALVRQHGAPADKVDVEQPFYWCDVAQTLHVLSAGGIDTDAVVLGTVNALLTLVAATGIKMIDSRRRALMPSPTTARRARI